jgi:hypothetical protein
MRKICRCKKGWKKRNFADLTIFWAIWQNRSLWCIVGEHIFGYTDIVLGRGICGIYSVYNIASMYGYSARVWKIWVRLRVHPTSPGTYTPRRRTAISVGAIRYHPAIGPLSAQPYPSPILRMGYLSPTLTIVISSNLIVSTHLVPNIV